MVPHLYTSIKLSNVQRKLGYAFFLPGVQGRCLLDTLQFLRGVLGFGGICRQVGTMLMRSRGEQDRKNELEKHVTKQCVVSSIGGPGPGPADAV